MSVESEESIYHLIPRALPRQPKTQRYAQLGLGIKISAYFTTIRHQSKFHSLVKQETQRNKTNIKTMVFHCDALCIL